MKKKINVLLIEDSEDDAILIKRTLKKDGFDLTIKRIETINSMRKELAKKRTDIVIADYALPEFNGLDALNLLQKSDLDIPFILVSGKIGEDTAVKAMKSGADDYIMKDNLKKLSPAVKRELQDYENKRQEQKAKKEVKKYHDKLEQTNKKLEQEVSDRKDAERNAIESKEYFQNVIDSTSKIIISVNNNGRITIWNDTAEHITGYKQKEVHNRTMSKLPMVNNPQKLKDNIKDIQTGKKTKFDAVIITKDNAKKIFRLNGSVLEGKGRKKIGVIFIGDDITKDAEMHGKLLDGNSYLVSDKKIDSAKDLFVDLARGDHTGLFISRLNPETIKSIFSNTSDIAIRLLSEKHISEYHTIPDLPSLIKEIESFSSSSDNPVVLLDGVHYLLTKYSFKEFINAIYQLNESIIEHNAMMFVRLDPSMFQKNQLAIIENELRTLPSQKIQGITLKDSVYDILKFIYQQNQNNALVPFKKVMSKFKISYSTAAKRLEGLEEKGLIFTRRQGKLRAIFISEKGKTLLHKREVAE